MDFHGNIGWMSVQDLKLIAIENDLNGNLRKKFLVQGEYLDSLLSCGWNFSHTKLLKF